MAAPVNRLLDVHTFGARWKPNPAFGLREFNVEKILGLVRTLNAD
jgi:hypothetical protein